MSDNDQVKRPELEKWFDGLKAEIKSELKWQRWVIATLAAAVFVPKQAKLPAPPDVAQLVAQFFT